jgi:hypothetical protein
MVPFVVRRNQLVGYLLLLRREARVERLERREKTRFVLGAHLRELLAQRKTLDCIHRPAVLPGGLDRLVERIRVLVHRLGHLLPLRLLRRCNFEFGLQKRDPPVDQLAGQHSLHRVMTRFALRSAGIRGRGCALC